MQFTIYCKNVGEPDSAAWPERYNERTDDPQAWAKEILQRFNDTLHPGESARELVRVEVEPNDVPGKHEWEKTNLVTIVPGGRKTCYDTYKCAQCGATGKRFGLEPYITPDNKKWRSCEG